ncbi:GNAT family N-acetyltransferase [bacterium]|nr:MAG: GNAT family N-acetyltransferase [bacterium]
MADSTQIINLASIQIAPLETKAQIRGAFANESDPDYQHLVGWFKTQAFIAQRERKSKTYLITHDGSLIGYINISTVAIEFTPPGLANTTSHDPQAVLMGKLFISETCRGNGIGRIAVQFVIGVALKMNELTGCAGILLHSHPSAVEFYEHMGFVHIENVENESTMFFKLP